MEILLYFIACLIIAILCAVLFKLCDMDEDSTTVLATIWVISLPWIISVPAIIVVTIINILVIKPIEFILRKIK